MRNFQKGFTLVELIVVITIIAILGTIAFVSLGWYSRDARNVKKSIELSWISRQIALKRVEWVNLLTFASNSGSTLTGTSIRISWHANYTLFSDKYIAGDINSVVLGGKPEAFIDDVFNVSYKIGATTLWNGSYEVAGTIEKWGGEYDTYVVWDWNPRTSADVRGPRDYIQGNIFYLTGATTYEEIWFKKWDSVWISSGTYTITDLKFWNEIHLNTTITTPGANIFLRFDETRHLIKKWDSNFAIDEWAWNLYVPYK